MNWIAGTPGNNMVFLELELEGSLKTTYGWLFKNVQMQGAQVLRNEEAHPAYAGYAPQMHSPAYAGAFLNSHLVFKNCTG